MFFHLLAISFSLSFYFFPFQYNKDKYKVKQVKEEKWKRTKHTVASLMDALVLAMFSCCDSHKSGRPYTLDIFCLVSIFHYLIIYLASVRLFMENK